MPKNAGMQEFAEWFDEQIVSILDGEDLLQGRIAKSHKAQYLMYRPEGLGLTKYALEADDLFRSSVAESEYPHSTRMHLEPATTDHLSAGCIHTNADGDNQDNGLQNLAKNNATGGFAIFFCYFLLFFFFFGGCGISKDVLHRC